MIRPDGRVRWWLLVAFAWGPMALGWLVHLIVRGRLETLALDPSVHVRMLVSLPLLLLAHQSLDERTTAGLTGLRHEHPEARDAIDAIEARMDQLRASHAMEVILLVLALAGGQAVLWGLASTTSLVGGVEREGGPDFATFWYTTIAVPLLQFVVLRFLWRWALWCYALVRLWGLRLATNAMHPDAAAGFKVLSTPVDAFAIFVGASCSVASAVWTTQIVLHGASIHTFAGRFIAFVVLAMVVACGPLFLFSPQIYRARMRDVHRYHTFAREYVDSFLRKWIVERDPASSPLGTSDIQSLNDLGGSYEKAEATRALAFGVRSILVLWVAALLPMFPIALSSMSIADMAHAVGKILQLPLM